MRNILADIGTGIGSPLQNREAFEAETRIETIMMVCDIEKHAKRANIMAWAVIAAASTFLPNAGAFVAPLILRIASMILNRSAWRELRAKLAREPGIVPSFRMMRVSLFVAGMTWAFLLFPLLTETMVHPARTAVGGTVIMAVAVIFSMLAHMRSVAISLAAGFLAGFALCLPWSDPAFAITAMLGAVAMGCCLVSFSGASARQKIMTARTLVLNRRLKSDLNASLEEAQYLATRDPLTGLYNRRAFFEGTEGWPHDDTSRFIMTLDLDHFKQVNDRHGHNVGDQVLIATARQIHALIDEMPGNDHRACRFGGEEFVILVSNIDQIAVYRHAEILRQRLRQIPLVLGMPDSLNVSASIGVAQVEPGETIDNALRRSDIAMYRAKDRGRDRVVLASELTDLQGQDKEAEAMLA